MNAMSREMGNALVNLAYNGLIALVIISLLWWLAASQRQRREKDDD